MTEKIDYRKIEAFRQYRKARRVAEYNRELGRKIFEEIQNAKAARLEAEFPDFAETYAKVERAR